MPELYDWLQRIAAPMEKVVWDVYNYGEPFPRDFWNSYNDLVVVIHKFSYLFKILLIMVFDLSVIIDKKLQ